MVSVSGRPPGPSRALRRRRRRTWRAGRPMAPCRARRRSLSGSWRLHGRMRFFTPALWRRARGSSVLCPPPPNQGGREHARTASVRSAPACLAAPRARSRLARCPALRRLPAAPRPPALPGPRGSPPPSGPGPPSARRPARPARRAPAPARRAERARGARARQASGSVATASPRNLMVYIRRQAAARRMPGRAFFEAAARRMGEFAEEVRCRCLLPHSTPACSTRPPAAWASTRKRRSAGACSGGSMRGWPTACAPQASAAGRPGAAARAAMSARERAAARPAAAPEQGQGASCPARTRAGRGAAPADVRVPAVPRRRADGSG